jgi:hypothetical protein
MTTSFMQFLLHEGPREYAAIHAFHFTQLSHDNWVFCCVVLSRPWEIYWLENSENPHLRPSIKQAKILRNQKTPPFHWDGGVFKWWA